MTNSDPFNFSGWHFLGGFAINGYNGPSYEEMARRDKENPPPPDYYDIDIAFRNILSELRNASPGDNSPEDRRWDAVITQVEQAEAYFRTYILGK